MISGSKATQGSSSQRTLGVFFNNIPVYGCYYCCCFLKRTSSSAMEKHQRKWTGLEPPRTLHQCRVCSDWHAALLSSIRAVCLTDSVRQSGNSSSCQSLQSYFLKARGGFSMFQNQVKSTRIRERTRTRPPPQGS